MERIQTNIENVVRYLAKALLESSVGTSMTRMLPDNYVPGESNYYYVMMTVWYTCKYFKDNTNKKLDCLGQLADQKRQNGLLFHTDRLPSNNWTFAKGDRDKVQLLQWYHYGSLQKLCKHGLLPTSWQGDPDLLEQKVARLAKAAKMVSSAKLSSRKEYVADDEIFDRLSFVSGELGLEVLEPEGVGAVEWLSMNRVKQRDFTRSLNPGWLPPGEEKSTSGPWEIHALCHHSRLVVLTKEEKIEQDWRTPDHTTAEAEICRQNILTFLNAEGTLVPCWERAHAKARRSWLHSEISAVVASTLIIILKKSMPADDTQAHQHQKKLLLEVRHLEGLMKGQLRPLETLRNESGLLPPIQWASFRLPRKYHPVSFFNSLDATPNLYKPQAVAKVSVPLSLQGHIDLPGVLREESKEFTKQDINKVLPMKCLLLFDIVATGPDQDDEGFTWQVKKYKYDDRDPCAKIKSADGFSWALYDNVSKPRAVLGFIY